jgi:hypothetical protein
MVAHAIFDELRTSVSEIEFLADPSVGELRVGSTESVGRGSCKPSSAD